jgi:hypothetical protein
MTTTRVWQWTAAVVAWGASAMSDAPEALRVVGLVAMVATVGAMVVADADAYRAKGGS